MFLDDLKHAHRSAHTIRAYSSDLHHFAAAWAHGMQLDLMATAEVLMVELAQHPMSAGDAQT